ncbi:metal-dependent hydrolase [uncultured Methanobrevibacter sp.]|uniref:metal-dependent hydrolase n=1 Tax=uncultured Methanobrevibacter sp. TaxID=253161 RepID=UPI0025F79FB9|nr:metal-dependent hydrolase [uncultured Methanobrevibacter sp.]
MSDYKIHSIVALVLALLFFQNPIAIALTLIGGNIPDNDHKIKMDNVYRLIIIGLLIFIAFYILKLPYSLGILICLLGLIFYFSSHRGFTHSIFGISLITIILFFIIKLGYNIILKLNILNSFSYVNLVSISICIIFISLFSINKKLLPLFIILFLLAVFLYPASFNELLIFSSIFLGLLSHSIVDLFSPAGVKLFLPLYNKKFHKKMATVLLIILILTAIVKYGVYFHYFNIGFLHRI